MPCSTDKPIPTQKAHTLSMECGGKNLPSLKHGHECFGMPRSSHLMQRQHHRSTELCNRSICVRYSLDCSPNCWLTRTEGSEQVNFWTYCLSRQILELAILSYIFLHCASTWCAHVATRFKSMAGSFRCILCLQLESSVHNCIALVQVAVATFIWWKKRITFHIKMKLSHR